MQLRYPNKYSLSPVGRLHNHKGKEHAYPPPSNRPPEDLSALPNRPLRWFFWLVKY
ncbi:unnamed protein product [Penicillium roqueforti FM164]|uniref:Uncharacterized protein n=1 Tax=Penicillium roqueforti (strain FM164) TaxID=1365484 RepID=W6QI44_PENRF|nr:unnamed protein product [Penicillium roqueforti FM164]